MFIQWHCLCHGWSKSVVNLSQESTYDPDMTRIYCKITFSQSEWVHCNAKLQIECRENPASPCISGFCTARHGTAWHGTVQYSNSTARHYTTQHTTALRNRTKKKNLNCATVEAVELEKQTPQKNVYSFKKCNTFVPLALLFYCMIVTYPLL